MAEEGHDISEKQKGHMDELAQRAVLHTEASTRKLSAEDQGRIRRTRKALLERNMKLVYEEIEGPFVEVGVNLRKLGDKIGDFQRNAAGETVRPPGSRSEKLHKRFDQSLEDALTFVDLQKGYDKVDATRRAEIRSAVKAMLLRNNKQIGIAKLPPAEQDAAVDEMLKDPDYARYIRKELTALQGMRLTSSGDYNIARQRQNGIAWSRDARVEQTNAAIEISNVAGTILQQVREHGIVTPEQRGPQVLEGDAQISRYETLLNNLETQRRTLTSPRRRRRDGGEYAGDRAKLKAITDLQENYAHEIAELRRSNQEHLPSIAGLEDRRLQRVQQHVAAMRQWGEEEVSTEAVTANLSDIENERAIEEQTLTEAMEGIFARAAHKKILTDLDFSIQTLGTDEPKLQAKELKAINEGISSHLQHTRWRKRPEKKRRKFLFFRKKQKEQPINTLQVNQDFDILNERGPDVLLRRILRNVRTKGAGGFPRTLTTEQIDHLMKNGEFKKEWGNQIAQQVLSRRSLFRPYRPSEVHHIMNTEWGKGAIQHAYETNQDYRTQVDFLTEHGEMDLDNPGFQRKFAQTAAEHPALLHFLPQSFPWLADDTTQVVEQAIDKTKNRYRLAA